MIVEVHGEDLVRFVTEDCDDHDKTICVQFDNDLGQREQEWSFKFSKKAGIWRCRKEA